MISRERYCKTKSTACAKVLGQDKAWPVGGTVRRPVWLKQSEQGGERAEVRVGRGRGKSGRALWGGLGLLSQGGGSPGGLWAEKGQDLSQVLKACQLSKGRDFGPP